MAIFTVLACFTLLPGARAVNPAPDGCFPNFTTAEGCNALKPHHRRWKYRTGLARALYRYHRQLQHQCWRWNAGTNNTDSNTAVGVVALLLNTSGTQNTAVGTNALVFNDSGDSNTATGYAALMNNTIGGANTAIGWEALTANTIGINNVALGTLPLSSNTSGNNNTAIGNLALRNNVSNSEHVAVGRLAGSEHHDRQQQYHHRPPQWGAQYFRPGR